MEQVNALKKIYQNFLAETKAGEECSAIKRRLKINILGALMQKKDEITPHSERMFYNRMVFSKLEGNVIYLLASTSFSLDETLDFLHEECSVKATDIDGTWFDDYSLVQDFEVNEFVHNSNLLLFKVTLSEYGLKQHEGERLLLSLVDGNNSEIARYKVVVIDGLSVAGDFELKSFKMLSVDPDTGCHMDCVGFEYLTSDDVWVDAVAEMHGEWNCQNRPFVPEDLEYVLRITDDHDNVQENYVLPFTSHTEEGWDVLIRQKFELDLLSRGWYKCEIYITNVLVVSARFLIDVNDEGKFDLDKIQPIASLKKLHENVNENALRQLTDMVGLESIKSSLMTNLKYVRMMKARKDLGLPTPRRLLHTVMMGNPGTGKTTVARLLGQIYHHMGILSKGHLVEVNREMLVDTIIGGTEKRTMACIEKAKGGILFADEAYSLTPIDEKDRDFGRQVIDTLMPVLSEADDMIVVFAGYPDEMGRLLKSNPGLASRFPIRYHFKDFTVEELLAIALGYLKKYEFTISEEGQQKMRNLFTKVVEYEDFGNGRFVKTFIENRVLSNMAVRVADSVEGNSDKQLLSVIKAADIPDSINEDMLERKESLKHCHIAGFGIYQQS